MKGTGNFKSPSFLLAGVWGIACRLLVPAAKDRDCCAQIAGNDRLLFVSFCLSRDSIERLLRSAGKLRWLMLPGVITCLMQKSQEINLRKTTN